jgi:hypothetical protein
MIAFNKVLTIVLFTLNFLPCHGCSCGRVSIDREVEKAYDFVVGRIGEERENYQDFTFSTMGKIYEWNTSYSYFLNVEYSFKDKIKGSIEFFGGKGRGDCGGIFEKGKTYLIVIYKGSKGYFTKLCSDHSPLISAGWQVSYLNQALGKIYELIKAGHAALLYVMLVLIVISLVAFSTKFIGFRTSRRKKIPLMERNLIPFHGDTRWRRIDIVVG